MEMQRRILVVDDDPDIVESIRLVLEANSYRVITSGGAEEGLARARSEKPDVILLDIMMPDGTEGFQFVWELRADKDPKVKATPIVILTAIHGTTELRFYPDQSDGTYKEGEYLPVQGFIDKPVEPRTLLAQLNKIIRGTQTQHQ
ncbi:MAG: response regulator [Bacteroidetes bacterium]|nr:response regulator [Bacteroidota bacterium]